MQIPASPHELTTDWLASVLDGQGLGPDSIQSFDVELLGGEQGMTGNWFGFVSGIRMSDPDGRGRSL